MGFNRQRMPSARLTFLAFERNGPYQWGIADNWEIQVSSWLPRLLSALQRQINLQLDAQEISSNSYSVLPEADEQAGLDSFGPLRRGLFGGSAYARQLTFPDRTSALFGQVELALCPRDDAEE